MNGEIGPGQASPDPSGSIEAMLRTVIEAVPNGIVVSDSKGAILLVNAEAERLFGYARGELVGRPLEILVPEASRAAHRDLRAGFGRDPHPRLMGGMRNLAGRGRDGTEIPLEIGLTAVETPDGLVIVASVVDITARQKMEQALRNSELRLRQLADSMSEVFFILAGTMEEMRFVNKAYEQVWGRSVEGLKRDPTSFLEAIPEDDRPGVRATLERVRQGLAAEEIEYRVIRPDGTLRWVRSRMVPLRDPASGTYNVSGIVRDVTEEREARGLLEDGLARFRKVSEATSDGIAVSVDGIVREANEGFASMFGYTLDEVLGRPTVEFATERGRPVVARHVGEEIEGTYEFEGRRKDGRVIIVEATGKAHSIGGRPGRITALRDVTERRALETRLRQVQRLEAIGRLAGGVAHDFNNLLTVMLGCSEQLIVDLPDDDPRREDAESIRQAALSGVDVTRQLLAFGRKQMLQPKVVSVNDVVRRAETVLRRMVGEDLELEWRLSDEPVNVLVDPGQVERILFNLVVNARDAMPNGGSVLVETKAVTLGDAYADSHQPMRAGAYVLMSVTDSGMGMDEETRTHIFEPFFTTKEMGHGSGLGLATVYGAVKQSDGFIWVYSEPGTGTTFKIYLPRVEPETADDAPADPPSVPRGNETVLLVEDNEAVRVVAERVLTHQGYTVISAADGATALRAIEEATSPVDVLVTDMRMPGMSGRELADRVSAVHPEIKVLFTSGYTDDAVVRLGLLDGQAAFLQKPFSHTDLARALRSVLDGAR